MQVSLSSLQHAMAAVANIGNTVFSKEDFNGFKDIGQGGKKGDVESTGMFGRGAQCLYHFTDLPELLSNDSFLVLDPQQQFLPIDPKMRRKRRVGVKMPFTTVNRLAPDQMAPFVGLYSFDPNQAKFDGTIFRFPLRAIGAKTSLKETQQTVDSAHVKYLLREYFATARTALLFLRYATSHQSSSRSGRRKVPNGRFRQSVFSVRIITRFSGLKLRRLRPVLRSRKTFGALV